MTDRDALIEEAAKAICKAHVEESTYGDFAAAALAVFEKAHTPTDDEREAWRDEAIRRYPHAEVAKYMRQALQNAFIEGAKFAADFRRTEVPEPPSREAWRDSIVDERCQQPSKGYTSDHDREHGLDHLLEWAQEYARIGEPLKSAALIEAARDLHRASEVPEPSAEGWSTEDRRAAEAEAKRRFLEWEGADDEGVQRFGAGSVSGFILGAEWWKATHPAPEPQGEPSDALPIWERPEAIEAARLAYQGAYEADYDAEDCIAFALRAAGGAR